MKQVAKIGSVFFKKSLTKIDFRINDKYLEKAKLIYC